MKKALSLFMAVLMIFGCFAVGASAIEQNPTNWFGEPGSGLPATYDQVICLFDTNGGTLKNTVIVYDSASNQKISVDKVSGKWAMIPSAPGTTSMTPGTEITLPAVTAPAGYQFDGWFNTADRQTYGANSSYTIPVAIGGNPTAGTVIEFRAAYSPTTIETDNMTKILGVLAKVFGAIIGVLLYTGDTAAGVDLVTRMLEGVLS